MSLSFMWLGHSAFSFKVGDLDVLIDPFLSGNPLAAGDPGMMPADVILVTHAHGDHVGDTVDIAKRTGANVICNVEMSQWFSKKGLENVTGGNTGGHVRLDGLTVKFTKAFHSSQFPDGAYGGQPGGFMMFADGKKLYHAGDTALFGDMALYATGDPIDVAFLPIGDFFTMGPEDSIQAIQLLKPKYVVPMHFNTFPPIVQDVSEWAEMVNRDTDAQPIVLDPGGSYTLD